MSLMDLITYYNLHTSLISNRPTFSSPPPQIYIYINRFKHNFFYIANLIIFPICRSSTHHISQHTIAHSRPLIMSKLVCYLPILNPRSLKIHHNTSIRSLCHAYCVIYRQHRPLSPLLLVHLQWDSDRDFSSQFRVLW